MSKGFSQDLSLKMSRQKRNSPESRTKLSYQCYALLAGAMGCVYSLLWFVLLYDDPVSHPWINVTEKEYILSSLAHQIQVRTPTISRDLVSASGFLGVPEAHA